MYYILYGQYGRGVEGRIVKPCKEGEGRDGGILKNSYHIFGCQGTWCRTSLRYRHCLNTKINILLKLSLKHKEIFYREHTK